MLKISLDITKNTLLVCVKMGFKGETKDKKPLLPMLGEVQLVVDLSTTKDTMEKVIQDIKEAKSSEKILRSLRKVLFDLKREENKKEQDMKAQTTMKEAEFS